MIDLRNTKTNYFSNFDVTAGSDNKKTDKTHFLLVTEAGYIYVVN